MPEKRDRKTTGTVYKMTRRTGGGWNALCAKFAVPLPDGTKVKVGDRITIEVKVKKSRIKRVFLGSEEIPFIKPTVSGKED